MYLDSLLEAAHLEGFQSLQGRLLEQGLLYIPHALHSGQLSLDLAIAGQVLCELACDGHQLQVPDLH